MVASPRIALITGAGSGIGRATAQAFWSGGYTVVLAGRREEKLRETAEDAGVDGARALIVPTDVSDRRAVVELFATMKSAYGRLDVLFNNAGISAIADPVETISEADWLSVVDINLNGAFWCIQEAFKLMKSQHPRGGRIINNGSLSTHVPRPKSAPYTATKHALTGLTKSIALDGRTYDIACGQIDIGNAGTDMTERMYTGVPQADGELRIEPTFDVRHAAQAVLYMANLPLDTNVPFMTVMANKMPYAGRG